MVERFSWVMLASMSSLGIQKILIEVGAWVSVGIILPIGLLLFIFSLWIGDKFSSNLRRVGGALLLLALLIRFAVPAMAFMNHEVYEKLLSKKYEEASGAIGKNVANLKDLEIGDESQDQSDNFNKKEEAEHGWFEKAKAMVATAVVQTEKSIDITSKIQKIKIISTGILDHMINLIVVFLINTIVLPSLFLLGILKVSKLVISHDFSNL